MVNGMKKLNRNGFTLIELIAVIVLLAIIMGIGAYSIVAVLNDYKNKSYNLLVENVKSAVEEYYIECEYDGGNSSIDCDKEYITLGDLVKYGFLKGNTTKDGGGSDLINPKDDVKINDCLIKYSYNNGKISVEPVSLTGSCPTSY